MDIQNRPSSLAAVIARMPQWIRHDLASQDQALRIHAEESLAAMIAAALAGEAVTSK